MIFCYKCNFTENYKINEIVNKFLLAGVKLCLSFIYNSLDLLVVFANHLLKTKKELKNLKKQEIQDIFTEMNLIKLFFNVIWFMKVLKI